MEKILLILLFVALAATSSAQELTSREVYGNFIFARDGQILTLNEMIREQPSGTELQRLLRSGRRNQTLGGVCGAVGGGLLGVALADLLLGNDNDESLNHWEVYVIAGALALVSIPLMNTAERRVATAVGLYNQEEMQGALPLRRGVEMRLGFVGNGVGAGLGF